MKAQEYVAPLSFSSWVIYFLLFFFTNDNFYFNGRETMASAKWEMNKLCM